MKISIILILLINTLIMMGTELFAQPEEVLWEEEISWEEVTPAEEKVWEEEDIWKEEVPQDLENELEFTEESTDSSESELDQQKIIISEENQDEVIGTVPIEEEPNQLLTIVSQESNTAGDTQASKIEPPQIAEFLAEEEISPQLASNETSTITTNQTLENTVDDRNQILPSITYDPPVILNYPTAIKAELPTPGESPSSVQSVTTEKLAMPQSVEGECNNPATYFNDIREAHLPAVEIPLYIDINGQPISSIGLFAVKLRIPFGFADFELKEAVFKDILLNSSPCNARFIPETRILNIPQVEIPTLITVAGSTTPLSVGPVIKCRAVLQQSNIRISVLSLKELQCNSPLPDPVQTDINY